MESPASLKLLHEAHHIDQSVTLAVNSWHSPVTDVVWQVFSHPYIWYILYVAVLVFMIRRLGWKRALIVLASCILTVLVCDQLANFTKAYFERLRPCWDQNMIAGGLHILEKKGGLYGFYSAHAANAMGFAACSWLGFRNDCSERYSGYAWFIFPWAFLVGLSRIFVGKHFAGDVVVGFLAGAFFGCLFAWLARQVMVMLKLSER